MLNNNYYVSLKKNAKLVSASSNGGFDIVNSRKLLRYKLNVYGGVF